MKFIYLTLISFFLIGCSTSKPVNSALNEQPKTSIKNPIAVTLYSGQEKPQKPYTVLAHETVSKYNTVGIKRQEANIKDSMRRLAATQGGDAIIEIQNHLDSISYTVISYGQPTSHAT